MAYKKNGWCQFVHFFLKDKKIFMIVLSVLLLGICVLFFQAINGSKARLQQQIKGLGDDEFVFALYREEIAVNENAHVIRELQVKGWMHEQSNTCYLFLPSFSQTDSTEDWRFCFNRYDSIRINQQEVAPGDVFRLEEGSHELVIGEGQKWHLKVLESDSVGTLFLETDTRNLEELRASKENVASGDYCLLDADGTVESSGKIEALRTRGNLSFTETDKKSFALNLKEKDALMGMEQSRKWVLTANAFDPTLSRNYIAEQFARQLGMAYVPQSAYVDLYIDGEYQGNYLLQEKVEIAQGRLEIRDLEDETEKINPGEDLATKERTIEDGQNGAQLRYVNLEFEPADITSGYLLELDMEHRYDNEASGFLSEGGQPVVMKSPQYAGKNQVAYVADIYQKMENALQSQTGLNEETGLYYHDYVDIESFAQKYLVDEVTKNLDASLSSFFLYVPTKKTVFYAGPIWDYDVSLGTDEVRNQYPMKDPTGLYAAEDIELDVITNRDHSLFFLLCRQETFQKAYKELYYDKMREYALWMADVGVEQNRQAVEASAVMDAIRWNRFGSVAEEEIREEFRNVNEQMQRFLTERIAFLDETWK